METFPLIIILKCFTVKMNMISKFSNLRRHCDCLSRNMQSESRPEKLVGHTVQETRGNMGKEEEAVMSRNDSIS